MTKKLFGSLSEGREVYEYTNTLRATTDKTTIQSPTHHSSFNLLSMIVNGVQNF